MSMNSKRRKLIHRLTNKAYRDAYVVQHSTIGLPFQIRAMRDARHWSQRELGERAGMAQETISLLENPGYGKFTLRTLNRLAAAFDVGLLVRFVPFSRLVGEMTDVTPEQLAVPSFESDRALCDEAPAMTSPANIPFLDPLGAGPVLEDDEPETDEKRVVVGEARDDIAAGRDHDWTDVRRELGGR